MNQIFKLSFTVLLSLFLFCCAGNKTQNIQYVLHGVSFGMCKGYCFQVDTFKNNQLIQYKHAWRDQLPDSFSSTNLTTGDWNNLIQQIDLDKLHNLPSIIGCPDCSDGGEEWLEIKTTDTVYSIHFDYGASITEIDPVLNYIRKIKSK